MEKDKNPALKALEIFSALAALDLDETNILLISAGFEPFLNEGEFVLMRQSYMPLFSTQALLFANAIFPPSLETDNPSSPSKSELWER